MHTIAPVYDANKGLNVSVQEFITLTLKTGLKRLPSQNLDNNAELCGLLRDNGPLWCAGFWYGFGHVIVLTGVEGNQVFLNDPDRGKQTTGTLSWFNDKLLNGLDGCIMAKVPTAY